jgi:hypothetical protein
MATNKAYTDFSQSMVLSKILPLESADMFYNEEPGETYPKDIVDTKYPMVIREGQKHYLEEYGIPCWSLAALLDIIPKHIKEYNVLRTDIGENDFSIWYDEVGYGVNDKLPDITMECPIDACYELILKLKEMNLL